MSFNQLIIQQDQSIGYRLQASDFDLSSWRGAENSESLSGGRGASQKIQINGGWYVLRQYLRGGLVARFIKDQYVWTGLIHSRPFVEVKAVECAIQHDLPVPEVLAYRVQKNGLLYRAAIITRFIPNQRTLARFLYTSQLADKNWRELGQLIRRLHRAHIFHADLNANNLLIGDDGQLYLIDFDKAKIMPQNGPWAEHTLQRLLRSLHKIQLFREQKNRPFHFNRDCWSLLLEGYK